jgi:hypothetical protein
MSDIDRKELKAPDAFFQSVGTANRFVQEHRAAVIAAGVGILALFFGAIGYRAHRENVAENAAAAFLRATDAMEESSPESARSALNNVASTSEVPYASLSSLYLAEIELQNGDPEAAASAYAEAAKELPNGFLKQAALVSQAFSLEQAGKAADAAAIYAGAAILGSTYQEVALRGQLRAAEAAGDTGSAKAAISALLEAFPQSDDADDLATKLERLQD